MMERICKWEMGGEKRGPGRTDDGMVPIQLNPVMNPAATDAILSLIKPGAFLTTGMVF
jgi:hypothetical protein